MLRGCGKKSNEHERYNVYRYHHSPDGSYLGTTAAIPLQASDKKGN
jgi:hypothetical protein